MKWTKSGGTFRTSHRFVIRLNHLLNNPDDNDQLEKATKKRRGGRASLGSNDDLPAWLERTVAIFDSIDQSTTRTSGHYVPVPPSGRKLRDRGKLNNTQNEKSISEPEKRKTPPKSAGSGSRKPRSSTDLSSEPVSLVSIQSEDSSLAYKGKCDRDFEAKPEAGSEGNPQAREKDPMELEHNIQRSTTICSNSLCPTFILC